MIPHNHDDAQQFVKIFASMMMMVQTVLAGVRAVSGGGGWCSVFSGDQASAPSPHQHAMLVSAHSVIQYSSFSF